MVDNVTSPINAGTVLASDDIGGVHYPRTKIVHGADGVAVDTSSANPLPVTDAALDAVVRAASISAAGVGDTFSTAGYGSVTFQITANSNNNTVVVEGSNNDGATWTGIATRGVTLNSTNSGSSGTGGSNGGAGLALIPAIIMPLMRWRVGTYIGGTTTVSVGLKRSSTINFIDAFVGNITGGGNSAGSTASGNPLSVGGIVATSNPSWSAGQRGELQFSGTGAAYVALGTPGAFVPISSFASDAMANSQNSLLVTGRNQVFNGTTWDRTYSIQSLATSGIGVQAVGAVARYSATLPTLTDGQYAALQIGTRGSLGITLFGQNSTSAVNVGNNNSDGGSAVTTLSVSSSNILFNGSTFDRTYSIQGLTTSGIGVQAVGKVGQFLTTKPTLTDGQYGRAQLTARGFSIAALGDGDSASVANVGNYNDDALSAFTGALRVSAASMIFNGTTLDRARSIPALATSGIGVQAVGMVGQYLDTKPTLTNGQYGRAQLGIDGSLIVASSGFSPTTTFTPTAVAYNAGAVIQGARTLASAGPASGGRMLILGARLLVPITAVPSGMTSFTLHLYSATPPSALANNTAWDLPSGDQASYLGSISMGSPVDLGSTLYVETNGLNKPLTVASGGSVFGYLVTTGAYTGTAVAYVVTLDLVQL